MSKWRCAAPATVKPGGARRGEPAVEPLEGGRVAGGDRVDRLVDGEGRGVADHGADVVERDLARCPRHRGRASATSARLAMRSLPMSCFSAARASGAMVRPARFGLLVDDAVEALRVVGIAGDGVGVLRLLEQLADGRGLAELAGGDDQDESTGGRREQRLDRRDH